MSMVAEGGEYATSSSGLVRARAFFEIGKVSGAGRALGIAMLLSGEGRSAALEIRRTGLLFRGVQ